MNWIVDFYRPHDLHDIDVSSTCLSYSTGGHVALRLRAISGGTFGFLGHDITRQSNKNKRLEVHDGSCFSINNDKDRIEE
jgi:hypothetical protein